MIDLNSSRLILRLYNAILDLGSCQLLTRIRIGWVIVAYEHGYLLISRTSFLSVIFHIFTLLFTDYVCSKSIACVSKSIVLYCYCCFHTISQTLYKLWKLMQNYHVTRNSQSALSMYAQRHKCDETVCVIYLYTWSW